MAITAIESLDSGQQTTFRTEIGAASSSEVVKLTGDQTVAGIKTFTNQSMQGYREAVTSLGDMEGSIEITLAQSRLASIFTALVQEMTEITLPVVPNPGNPEFPEAGRSITLMIETDGTPQSVTFLNAKRAGSTAEDSEDPITLEAGCITPIICAVMIRSSAAENYWCFTVGAAMPLDVPE